MNYTLSETGILKIPGGKINNLLMKNIMMKTVFILLIKYVLLCLKDHFPTVFTQ